MNNIMDHVKVDETDPNYMRLKDAFIEEIKQRFTSESYEPIVE